MPEINPVTKDQLFEKKIAENTGSNYKVGDISDIVPVTKDQALLKEIALNSAGQSGDITELEGKVADNTGAIEAIVNRYGSKNICPNNATTQSKNGATFTVNSDGSVTIDTAGVSVTTQLRIADYVFDAKKGSYILSGHIPSSLNSSLFLQIWEPGITIAKNNVNDEELFTLDNDMVGATVEIDLDNAILDNVTIYPMVRDARITDPTYVPYAMTNRELTDAVNNIKTLLKGGIKQ